MELIEGHKQFEPPAGVPVWDVDPYDEAILADPFEYFAELRSKGPFVYIPKYSLLCCGRHVETQEVFSDHARFVSSRGVGLLDFELAEPWRPPSIVLEVDPPVHAIPRRVLMRSISPIAVAGLKDSFRQTAEDIVDQLLEKQQFETVVDLAEAFPLKVFPDALGLKEFDRGPLIDYGAMVFNSLGPDNALRRGAAAKAPELSKWVIKSCKREMLDDEGFGATIYAAADAGEITEEQASLLVRSLLSAGIDTTVTGIGNAMWAFATNPGEFEKLKADPTLARPACDEVLRYTSPVHSFCRTANLDTSVSDISIEEGSKILCTLGSANRDPDRWENADQFNIARRPAGHLAFGSGIHVCVGQNVARAEMEAVFTALANKVDKIELIDTPKWRPNNSIHALDRMEVRIKPR